MLRRRLGAAGASCARRSAACCVAIRENEQRARVRRAIRCAATSSIAFVDLRRADRRRRLRCSRSTIASSRPNRCSVTFSGEIAGDDDHRRHAQASSGPALGALFYILFRELLSDLDTDTGCSGSACCSSRSSSFRRAAWSALGQRLWAHTQMPRLTLEAAAMAARGIAAERRGRCRPSCGGSAATERRRRSSPATGVVKRFGGLHRGRRREHRGRRPRAARADRPQRRRQDHALQCDLRPVPAGRGRDDAAPAQRIDGPVARRRSRRAGLARSFQITNLFPAPHACEENLRLGLQARDPGRFDAWRHAAAAGSESTRETEELIRFLGLDGDGAGAGRRPSPTAASGWSTSA